MTRTIPICLLLAATMAIGQGGNGPVFEQKNPSAGVPFAWPAASVEASKTSITRAEVLRFIADLDHVVDAIQSFRFVPLEKDKSYLVADVDASGNDFFGYLKIVHCEGAACVVGSLLTEAEDLDSDLVDVNGDGVFHVITKQATSFRSISTRGSPPFLYSIWSLIGGEIVDTSAKYPEYFKSQILPRMEAERPSRRISRTSINLNRSI